MITKRDNDILRDLECIFEYKENIFDYYDLIDRTHIINQGGIHKKLESNGTMQAEESINIISAILIDLLVNGKISILVNDIGNVPSRSDMMLSNKELLEMKRIPIGTNEYSKSKKMKYPNVEADKMGISNIITFVRDKINEYSPSNIGNKQKADYIGFYFAVSNPELGNKSIEYIHTELKENLKNELSLFKDIFFIFNRISVYDTIKEESKGETTCLSLKTGRFTLLTFNTPVTLERRIRGNLDTLHNEGDIISSHRERTIQISFNAGENWFSIMNSIPKGVVVKKGNIIHGFGNFPIICIASALYGKNFISKSVDIISDKNEGFDKGKEEITYLPFIIRTELK